MVTIPGQGLDRCATIDSRTTILGTPMTLKMIPALCAALLLLAACGSDSENITPANPNDVASNQPGSGIDSSNVGSNGTGSDAPGSDGEFKDKIGNTVYFETDSYSLNAQSQTALQKQAAWLKTYPQHAVTIEGHADERGTREYNLALGDRRAQTIVNYLTALGIEPARLKEVSFGKERPVCPDATDSCWQQNRRGVTTLDN